MNKILLPLLLLLFAACNSRPEDDRPVLTVSIEPLRFIVESVAGDKYRVVTLMPQGASPETYEPTPRQMMELNGSKALFRVGTLGFEKTKLPQMAATAPDVRLFDLEKGIIPIMHTGHAAHEGESQDPHVWMSAENLRIMAENACEALCSIDTVNAEFYKQRLSIFNQSTDSLDAEIKNRLNTLQNRAFLIYHPALGYFARQYGLQQFAVEHDGKEPSAAYMEQLINNCRAEEVGVVFISKEHSGRAAQRVAEALKARVVTINPLDHDVPAQMRLIAKELNHE